MSIEHYLGAPTDALYAALQPDGLLADIYAILHSPYKAEPTAVRNERLLREIGARIDFELADQCDQHGVSTYDVAQHIDRAA